RVACQMPAAAATATATTHGNEDERVRSEPAGAAPVSETSGTTSSIAAISILTSPMSLRRYLGSFVRHRSNSRRIVGGVALGSTDQSGSRSRIFAMVSET